MSESLSEISARGLWRECTAVCLDVDSTVCKDEAIDSLAEWRGVGNAVAEWTAKAMGGGLSFRQALTQRLALIAPSRDDLEDFCRHKPPSLTPGIAQLVKTLHQRRTEVFLVSGGFRRMIQDVADLLNIPHENIYANVILFDENGKYVGFDESCPTSDTGGKAEVVRRIKRGGGYEKVAMVGDGITDAEAAPPADLFVHFAGNQMREAVAKLSPWTVHNFSQLTQELLHPRLI